MGLNLGVAVGEKSGLAIGFECTPCGCHLQPYVRLRSAGSEHIVNRGVRTEFYTTPEFRWWEDKEEPGKGPEKG